ncbi:DUF551 domain-containing protein [Escherichia coli]
MSTITKEWLQQKIADMEAIRDDIPFGLGEDGTNTLAALRIALASLEAEPVAYIFKHPAGRLFWSLTDESNKGQSDVMPVYTAPPAPVSVPDAMEMDDDFDSAFEHGKAVGWNACRAAILQGAEPVQGWIPCSDRMPTKNDRVLIFINFNSDTVPPSIHDAQFTGSTFRRGNATVNVFPLEDGYGVTHWMPLPAAPQQEA